MKAFTLLEMVVVLGILAASSLFLLPISLNQIQDTKVSSEIDSLSGIVFQYQQNAYSRKDNKSYGIAFFSNRYTLYIGETLATAEYSENVFVPNNINIHSISFNGGNELTFSAGSFRPLNAGSIQYSTDGETYSMSINSEGLIETTKL